MTSAKTDRDLIKSNAGEHWLAQFDNKRDVLQKYDVMMAATFLRQAPEKLASAREDGGITVQMLQNFVLATADHLITSQETALFGQLVSQLCSARYRSRANWQGGGQQHCVPILETLVAKVEELRGSRNRKAVSIVLPDTFGIRSNMLPIPHSAAHNDTASEQEWQAFASELVGLLHRLAGGKNVPYHNDFARLKKDVQNMLNAADRIKVASLLCHRAWEPQAGDEEPSLADYLRLELAGGLLIQAAEAKSDGVDNSVLQAFYFGGKWIFSPNRGSPMEAARWVCGGRKFAPLGVTTSSTSTAA